MLKSSSPHPETLAEGRSKIRDAKTHQVMSPDITTNKPTFIISLLLSQKCLIHRLQPQVAVVTKEFLAGWKTEGLVTMIRQHIISEWGAEGAEEKVLICNPCNLKTIFWTG